MNREARFHINIALKVLTNYVFLLYLTNLLRLLVATYYNYELMLILYF